MPLVENHEKLAFSTRHRDLRTRDRAPGSLDRKTYQSGLSFVERIERGRGEPASNRVSLGLGGHHGIRTRAAVTQIQLAYRRSRWIAVGTLITERPPAQIRTGPIRAYGLYGSFLVKGALRHFCRASSLHSFVRPAQRAFFRPDRILPSPSRTATVMDGACSAPPKACP
jgi:hypothetical protein